MKMRIKFRPVAALAVLVVMLASMAARAEGPSGYEFVEMPDGVQIAISVKVPAGCTAETPCATIFEMSGYDGGGASADDRGTMSRELGLEPVIGLGDDSRQLTRHFDDEAENGAGDYVVVHASVRGSGCSGGEFDLFSWAAALDGKYIIDNWIPAQTWSNGDVGLVGHSYSGLTGTLIAATQPEHLRVISVSGLIDDLYRGITYPGGVSNMGFPPLWTLGIRSLYDVGGGLLPRLVRPVKDGYPEQTPECIAAASTKSRSVLNDPVLQGGTSDFDNGWYQQRSLVNHITKVRVPVHIVGAYQDEQTGARGPSHVWEKVRTRKRLVLSNGNHDTAGLYDGTNVTRDRVDWLNHYLYDVPFEEGLSSPKVDPSDRVRVYLESTPKGNPNGIIDAKTFPLPKTEWTDFYFDAGEQLTTTPPAEGSIDYVSGSPRHGWFREFGETEGAPLTTAQGPDELQFATTIEEDTIVVGPITANIDLSTTSPDTELYVEVIDQAPDGTRAYLQRGVLKASHRAIIPTHSDCVGPEDDDDDEDDWERVSCNDEDAYMYRPFRPHVAQDLLTPGERYDLLVEVWPLGHVFRAGHQLRVLVTTPPIFDNYYAYVPKRPVGINTVYFGDSKITMPVLPMDKAEFVKTLGAPVSCNDQDALRCLSAGQY